MTRVLYLGQKPIGERCFELLLDAGGIEVAGAVSNPEASAWWGSAGVRERAEAEGIPFLANTERAEDEIEAMIRDRGAEALVSVQHTWVLPGRLLDAVDGRAFNLHNAPLPEYKGYNAANHAILNDERRFAATVHWMAEEVDAGEAAFVESFPVPDGVTAAELYELAADAGLRAFARLVDALARGEEVPQEPLRGESRFYPREAIDELRLIADPGDPDEVDRKARAFHFPPFEPAYFLVDGEKRHVAPGELVTGPHG